MSGAAEVWVWLSRDREGALSVNVNELLYEARSLCRRFGADLTALGDREPTTAEMELLGRWGVGAVRIVGRALPLHPLCEDGRSPLAELAGAEPPRVFLMADDAFGKVVAPLWAADTGARFVPSVSGITADASDEPKIVAARSTHGEQFESLVTLDGSRPIVVTLIPGAVGEGAEPPGALARNPRVQVRGAAPVRSVDAPIIHPPDPESLDLADAERIVAFGRGGFTPQAVSLVARLAELLGAAVAGSRPAADEGWIPFSRQIGLTGAIVRPKLYVTVGISGAPYHMAGVKDPETLIAINSDPEAPIFGSADLGIVGDLYRVLPELIARLERGEPLAGAAAAETGAAAKAP